MHSWMPPNAPALLYWSCVVEPPGLPANVATDAGNTSAICRVPVVQLTALPLLLLAFAATGLIATLPRLPPLETAASTAVGAASRSTTLASLSASAGLARALSGLAIGGTLLAAFTTRTAASEAIFLE